MRSFAAVLVVFLVGSLAVLVLGTLLSALIWNDGRVNISVNYWGEGWGEVGLVVILLITYPWAVKSSPKPSKVKQLPSESPPEATQ